MKRHTVPLEAIKLAVGAYLSIGDRSNKYTSHERVLIFRYTNGLVYYNKQWFSIEDTSLAKDIELSKLPYYNPCGTYPHPLNIQISEKAWEIVNSVKEGKITPIVDLYSCLMNGRVKEHYKKAVKKELKINGWKKRLTNSPSSLVDLLKKLENN